MGTVSVCVSFSIFSFTSAVSTGCADISAPSGSIPLTLRTASSSSPLKDISCSEGSIFTRATPSQSERDTSVSKPTSGDTAIASSDSTPPFMPYSAVISPLFISGSSFTATMTVLAPSSDCVKLAAAMISLPSPAVTAVPVMSPSVIPPSAALISRYVSYPIVPDSTPASSETSPV